MCVKKYHTRFLCLIYTGFDSIDEIESNLEHKGLNKIVHYQNLNSKFKKNIVLIELQKAINLTYEKETGIVIKPDYMVFENPRIFLHHKTTEDGLVRESMVNNFFLKKFLKENRYRLIVDKIIKNKI